MVQGKKHFTMKSNKLKKYLQQIFGHEEALCDKSLRKPYDINLDNNLLKNNMASGCNDLSQDQCDFRYD